VNDLNAFQKLSATLKDMTAPCEFPEQGAAAAILTCATMCPDIGTRIEVSGGKLQIQIHRRIVKSTLLR